MNEITTTISSKGQITLPKKFRDKLNITPNNKVKLTLNNNKITIQATPDILEVAKEFVAQPGKSPLEAREYMETHYERF